MAGRRNPKAGVRQLRADVHVRLEHDLMEARAALEASVAALHSATEQISRAAYAPAWDGSERRGAVAA